MKTYRYKNWFFEPMFFKPGEITEETFKLLAFDIWKVKGYEVLTTLSKAYYNNYRYVEIDLFRHRLWLCFGIKYRVDFEMAREERRKNRARNV